MAKAAEISGERFGRLVVTGRVEHRPGRVFWSCRCDCGGEAVVCTNDLRSGNTRSCGCLHVEMMRARTPPAGWLKGNLTHGLCYSAEYYVWGMMKNRCSNPKVARYEDYGGRGIRVCERWRKFENFIADMGPRPEGVSSGGRALYSLERIDNDGHYEPGNCRWATAQEQAANKQARHAL